MIKQEAKEIQEKIEERVFSLNIGVSRKERAKIGKMVAIELKEATQDGVYQHVINNFNEKIDKR